MVSRKTFAITLFSLFPIVLPLMPADAEVAPSALAEIAVIPVGEFPIGLALNLDGSRLYIVDHFGGVGPAATGASVSIIDTSTNSVVDTIPLGEGFPGQITVTPDGSRAYIPVSGASGSVVSTGPNRIEVLDLATSSVADTIFVVAPISLFGPIGIDLTPDGTRAYVSDRGNQQVLVLDTDPQSMDFHSILATVAVPGFPVGVAVTPGGTRAYVASRQSSMVSMITTATNTVDASFPAGIGPSSSITAVATSPDGTRAYVTYATDSRIAVIDTVPGPNFNKVQVVPTGGGPLGRLIVTPDGKRVFAAAFDGQLLILDTDSSSASFHQVLASVPVGNQSADVVFQSSNAAVAYVVNVADNTISVLGVSKQALTDLIAGMDPSVFSNRNHQKTLLNKTSAVLAMIEEGNLCAAASKLTHDILPKTDGEPAPADWVIDPDAQQELQSTVEACIGQLLVEAQGTCP